MTLELKGKEDVYDPFILDYHYFMFSTRYRGFYSYYDMGFILSIAGITPDLLVELLTDKFYKEFQGTFRNDRDNGKYITFEMKIIKSNLIDSYNALGITDKQTKRVTPLPIHSIFYEESFINCIKKEYSCSFCYYTRNNTLYRKLRKHMRKKGIEVFNDFSQHQRYINGGSESIIRKLSKWI